MNIFILDLNITKCAQYHCDKHVVKMILESAQILSTVCYKYGIQTQYRPTHINHPCTLWAGKSISNWLWLKDLALQLNDEYKFRFNKCDDHKSATIINQLPCPPIPKNELTEFVQAMPLKYKNLSPVQAYRQYYIHEKFKICTWKKRSTPQWFKENGCERSKDLPVL